MFPSNLKTMVVIAGGPSVQTIPLELIEKKPTVYFLGVNDAALKAPEGLCDGVLTMDRLWWYNRHEEIIKIGEERPFDAFIRHSVYDRYAPYPDFVKRIYMEYKLTHLNLERWSLNGNNSGFCAFNLAVLSGATDIFLFGFDMQGPRHARWYKNYEWDKSRLTGNHYRKWSPPFDTAAKVCHKLGLKVFNCNLDSRIQALPLMKPEKAIKLLNERGGFSGDV